MQYPPPTNVEATIDDSHVKLTWQNPRVVDTDKKFIDYQGTEVQRKCGDTWESIAIMRHYQHLFDINGMNKAGAYRLRSFGVTNALRVSDPPVQPSDWVEVTPEVENRKSQAWFVVYLVHYGSHAPGEIGNTLVNIHPLLWVAKKSLENDIYKWEILFFQEISDDIAHDPSVQGWVDHD